MEWIARSEKMPPDDGRIMVFSPKYREDDAMRYRILDSHFFLLMDEATHWAKLEEPVEKEVNELLAGWGWPALSRKAHYFTKGSMRSICMKWMYTGPREGSAEKAGPDDCAECKRRAAKLVKP